MARNKEEILTSGFELKNGDIIRIPEYDTLYEVYGTERGYLFARSLNSGRGYQFNRRNLYMKSHG